MKHNLRIWAIAAALSLSFAAHATKPGNNPPPFQEGGDSSAAAVAVGIGQGGDAKASNTNIIGVANDATAHSLSYSGGNKLVNEGNNAAQRTNTTVTVQGDTTESNTPPVVAGILPSVPTSCRLYLFGGGSTRDGAGSGTFPIGNDQTCLSIAMLNLMERAGGFTQAEKQLVVCKVEGMAALPTCQAAAK